MTSLLDRLRSPANTTDCMPRIPGVDARTNSESPCSRSYANGDEAPARPSSDVCNSVLQLILILSIFFFFSFFIFLKHFRVCVFWYIYFLADVYIYYNDYHLYCSIFSYSIFKMISQKQNKIGEHKSCNSCERISCHGNNSINASFMNTTVKCSILI